MAERSLRGGLGRGRGRGRGAPRRLPFFDLHSYQKSSTVFERLRNTENVSGEDFPPLATSLNKVKQSSRVSGKPPVASYSADFVIPEVLGVGVGLGVQSRADTCSVNVNESPCMSRTLGVDDSYSNQSIEFQTTVKKGGIVSASKVFDGVSKSATAESVEQPADVEGRKLLDTSDSRKLWSDFFKSNREKSDSVKLVDDVVLEGNGVVLTVEDVQSSGPTLIGYLAGRFTGRDGVIKCCESWKKPLRVFFHPSNWVVMKFENDKDKNDVLANGPYLIFGTPFLIQELPDFFEFDSFEMRTAPVWVKLPGLPINCWTIKSLSKIAKHIGRPIQTDQVTLSGTRIEYARVLVEVDVSKEPCLSVDITLPNGKMIIQPIEYEHWPDFCVRCKAIGHKDSMCKKTGETTQTQQQPVSVQAGGLGQPLNKDAAGSGSAGQELKGTSQSQYQQQVLQQPQQPLPLQQQQLKQQPSAVEKNQAQLQQSKSYHTEKGPVQSRSQQQDLQQSKSNLTEKGPVQLRSQQQAVEYEVWPKLALEGEKLQSVDPIVGQLQNGRKTAISKQQQREISTQQGEKTNVAGMPELNQHAAGNEQTQKIKTATSKQQQTGNPLHQQEHLFGELNLEAAPENGDPEQLSEEEIMLRIQSARDKICLIQAGLKLRSRDGEVLTITALNEEISTLFKLGKSIGSKSFC